MRVFRIESGAKPAASARGWASDPDEFGRREGKTGTVSAPRHPTASQSDCEIAEGGAHPTRWRAVRLPDEPGADRQAPRRPLPGLREHGPGRCLLLLLPDAALTV